MKNLSIGLCALILMILQVLPVNAQQSKLRKAQHYMESLQYDKAIGIYNKLYLKNPSSIEAINGLAKAYQKHADAELAIEWYTSALEQEGLPASFFFYFGQLLMQKGDCGNAQVQFSEFLRLKPYDNRRFALEDICSYWDTIANEKEVAFTINHPGFNGIGSDLAPAFFKESLVFGSVRLANGKRNVSYDLYCTQPKFSEDTIDKELSFGPVTSFSNTLNSVLNEAIITFSPDNTEAYFTRNRKETADEKFPIRRLEILVSHLNGRDVWSTPEALTINNPQYSTAHPALSPDGNRLFFASDRPGGFGGKDIYVCNRQGLDWSTPVNLGPNVNTEGDELYPFFHSEGILYFASDGQLGLGGHDVFKVEEQEEGTWGKVINIGFPINSEADDFGLILSKDSSYGFLTSNREGGAGNDDIYAFSPKRIFVELNLVESDGESITNMVALLEKHTTNPVLTDENGKFSLWLNKDECKYFTVLDENYFPYAAEICASDAENNKNLSVDWTLKKKQLIDSNPNINPDSSVKGPPVLYGRVLDELTGHVLSNAKIELQGIDCDGVVSLTSDENGQFTYDWKDDCCYTILVSKEGFFSETLTTPICKNEEEPQPLILSIAPYRLNKDHEEEPLIVESVYDDDNSSIPYKLNIYYDLGRASVRAEGIEELDRLKIIMENNPKLVIEVSSHTDTRGTTAYNWKLSQRRANAIVNYLIKRGISSDRLVAKGYGEQRLVNNCDGSIECSEEEHQLNRRTEFRVLEHKYGDSN